MSADDLDTLAAQLAARDTDLAAMLARARSRLLAALAESTPRGALVALEERLALLFDLPPQVIDGLLARCLCTDGWESSPFADVQLFHLQGGPRRALADCGFVRIAANGVLPAHTHSDPELSLVLQGSVCSDDEPALVPGDGLYMPPGSRHGLRAAADGVLLAVVTRMAGLSFDPL